MTFDNLFRGKKENGNGDPAPKKLCVEQKLELSYAERAKLPSVYSPFFFPYCNCFAAFGHIEL